MAVFTIKLNEYFLDTFIEVLDDELNKLEHKNDDKQQILTKQTMKYLNLEDTQAKLTR